MYFLCLDTPDKPSSATRSHTLNERKLPCSAPLNSEGIDLESRNEKDARQREEGLLFDVHAQGNVTTPKAR
jgi:hypothetical protein